MKKILFVLVLLATVLSAAEADPRAGLWQGTATIGGQTRTLWLLLRMNLPLEDRPYPHSGIWMPRIYGLDESGQFCGVTDVQLAPGRVAIRCVRYTQETVALGLPDYTFEGMFDPQAGITGTWLLGDKKIPIRYTRPPSTGIAQMQGDWVASSVTRTCILHIYDEPPRMFDYGPAWCRGTLDRFIDEDPGFATLGEAVSLSPMDDGSVAFSASTSPVPLGLVGKLNIDKTTFSAHWSAGNPLGCDDSTGTVVFHRALPGQAH